MSFGFTENLLGEFPSVLSMHLNDNLIPAS